MSRKSPNSTGVQQLAAVAFTLLRLLWGRAPLPVLIGVVVVGVAAAWLLPGLAPSLLPGGDGPNAPSNNGGPPPVASVPAETTDLDRLATDAGLRRVGARSYESPAGIRYRRGSRHGHRLLHLQSHLSDDPGRPQKHGVFDVDDMAEAVAIVDEAYDLAGRGQYDDVERESGRTVYRVNMNRRVGYTGGSWGAGRGRPPCKRVQLVLEGDNLITAYPVY